MDFKRLKRRLVRISIITLVVIMAALVGFNFWFKAHARKMIEDMVETKSNGKLKLKVDKFSFNWFTKKLEFRNAVFYSTDSVNENTSYSFRVDHIKLKVQAILPIVFKKRIVIDTMTLLSPEITVTRNRASEKKETKDVSLPEEMGKVYNSIQDALRVLKVSRFLIDNGTFKLVNKVQADQQPITITNLRFQVDNLAVDTTIQGAREKILFSDNVILQSHNQDILFPDGRHRLSFSRFRINLQSRLVEFDSCTIAATRKDSAAASFSIFLDKLRLIDIDFDTLYKHEVIKADSVYCVNPTFNLEVEVGRKKAKAAPKLEEIIKQLTGDMLLGYVVVNNADFNIKTIRNGVPSSFTSTDNNFEMQGLSIDQDRAKPLKVKSFAMAIRNYENFLRDSTYSVSFDSVLFREDRIYLSNFIFHKLERGKIINTFNIPQFYLGGLSWDDLVFENRLKADQATLFNPYISYSVSDKFRKKPGRQNIFQSLGAVNDYMDIEYLDIVDGTIDLRVNENVRVQLQDATLAIQSHNLLTSTKLAGIKNSLTQLDFKKGVITTGDLVMDLRNIHYIGNSGKFGADQIFIKERNNKVAISLEEVAVEKMLIDEVTGDIYSEDISWKSGDIKFTGGAKGGDMNSFLALSRVSGRNTKLTGTIGNTVYSADLDLIKFDQLDKRPGEKLMISGLQTAGKQFRLKNDLSLLSMAGFAIIDKGRSELKGFTYHQKSTASDINISIPSITAVPYIQKLLHGSVELDGVTITKPDINIKLTGSSAGKSSIPAVDINSLIITQPNIQFSQVSDSGIMNVQWQMPEKESIQLQGIHVRGEPRFSASLDKIRTVLSHLSVAFPNQKHFNTRQGTIETELSDIKLQQKETGAWDWNAMVSSLRARNFSIDSVGKKQGRLEIQSLDLSALGISSASIVNMQKLAAANAAFQIKRFNGSFIDSNTAMFWYNAGLTRGDHSFSMDSFTYRPALARDSFMAKQGFQTDFMTLKTGAIRMGPVDIDTYIKDEILNARSLTIDDLYFSDFRDNTLPFKSGVIKSLPVAMLKKIPVQFSFDSINLRNAKVDYTQVGEKTKQAATIPIRRMEVEIKGAKNYDLNIRDSLDIVATGYLMDTGWIRVHVRESYIDSLNGFLVNAQLRPLDLTSINSLLIPLSSVMIQSGFLDTVSLVAVGGEHVAYGEMKMYYRDLKVRFLKDSDEAQKSLLKSVMNFIANSFVIKNKNESRTGIIFLYRDRDRSAINYLVKIAMSGVNSSVGVKSNKKQLRAYMKKLDVKQLPGINFD